MALNNCSPYHKKALAVFCKKIHNDFGNKLERLIRKGFINVHEFYKKATSSKWLLSFFENKFTTDSTRALYLFCRDRPTGLRPIDSLRHLQLSQTEERLNV